MGACAAHSSASHPVVLVRVQSAGEAPEPASHLVEYALVGPDDALGSLDLTGQGGSSSRTEELDHDRRRQTKPSKYCAAGFTCGHLARVSLVFCPLCPTRTDHTVGLRCVLYFTLKYVNVSRLRGSRVFLINGFLRCYIAHIGEIGAHHRFFRAVCVLVVTVHTHAHRHHAKQNGRYV